MKVEFSGQIFEKCSNINFQERPPVGAESIHEDRRTDGHMMNLLGRFSQFCEPA